jgi:hypothetical protein
MIKMRFRFKHVKCITVAYGAAGESQIISLLYLQQKARLQGINHFMKASLWFNYIDNYLQIILEKVE